MIIWLQRATVCKLEQLVDCGGTINMSRGRRLSWHATLKRSAGSHTKHGAPHDIHVTIPIYPLHYIAR